MKYNEIPYAMRQIEYRNRYDRFKKAELESNGYEIAKTGSDVNRALDLWLSALRVADVRMEETLKSEYQNYIEDFPTKYKEIYTTLEEEFEEDEDLTIEEFWIRMDQKLQELVG